MENCQVLLHYLPSGSQYKIFRFHSSLVLIHMASLMDFVNNSMLQHICYFLTHVLTLSEIDTIRVPFDGYSVTHINIMHSCCYFFWSIWKDTTSSINKDFTCILSGSNRCPNFWSIFFSTSEFLSHWSSSLISCSLTFFS